MNQLEKAIIDCTRAAQRDYENMTDRWLWHGPESFIMCSVATKLSKKMGFWVFIDASPRKIQEERDERPGGRPPKNLDNRFDMVVWQKDNKIRAILEIKRAWSIDGLRRDRKKIGLYMKNNNDVNAGYLLAYTEAKGLPRDKTLSNRLKNWANALHCELVGYTMDAKGDGEWGWAVGLLRLAE
jgi:hypothetical protein